MTDRTDRLYRKTVKGRKYLYFRLPSGRLLKLPPEGSPGFARAYDACVRLLNKEQKESAAAATDAAERKPAERKPIGGSDSVSAAVAVYHGSLAFTKLRPKTRVQYEHTLDQMGEWIGDQQIAAFDTDALDIYSEKVAQQHGLSVGDRHVKLFSMIWKVCRKHPQFKLKGLPNPTYEAELRYKVDHRHRPWPAHVQADFMRYAPERLRLAKLLLHFSGQRGGDGIKIKWTDYDGKGLYVRPEKTHGEVAAQANYHICPKPLREALDKAKPHATAETILVNAWGKPYTTSNVLSAAIRRELVALGHAEKGKRTYVMHGLRKNAASDVASLAFGAAGVKSVTGHKSDREANEYAAHADRLRINTMVVQAWDAELERQEQQGQAPKRARRAKLKVVK